MKKFKVCVRDDKGNCFDTIISGSDKEKAMKQMDDELRDALKFGIVKVGDIVMSSHNFSSAVVGGEVK